MFLTLSSLMKWKEMSSCSSYFDMLNLPALRQETQVKLNGLYRLKTNIFPETCKTVVTHANEI